MIFVNKRGSLMPNYHYGSYKLRKVKCTGCGKIFFTDHPCKKTCSIECSMIQKEVARKQADKNSKRYYSKVRKVKNKK